MENVLYIMQKRMVQVRIFQKKEKKGLVRKLMLKDRHNEVLQYVTKKSFKNSIKDSAGPC